MLKRTGAMSLLIIRANKRFGVLRKASLRAATGRARPGLLIELSLEGCRISRIDHTAFHEGQAVTVRIEGFKNLEAHVRWAHSDCVGLRLVVPLHSGDLNHMVTTCRVPEPAQRERAPVRGFGT